MDKEFNICLIVHIFFLLHDIGPTASFAIAKETICHSQGCHRSTYLFPLLSDTFNKQTGTFFSFSWRKAKPNNPGSETPA
jgi:hypothetical protein